MRERWTDDRLDDLNGKVDALRVEMKAEFKAVRGEIDRRFDKMDERFDKVDERFEKIDGRFDKVDERFEKIDDCLYAMQRLMIQFCGVALAALLGVLGTLVAVAIQL